MAWDTTDLSSYNDIIVQDGVFAYNFEAKVAIKKGQAVSPSGGNNKVAPTNDTGNPDAIGFACYDASAGEQVAVAGPGNIVWCCLDTTVAVGTLVYGDTAGVLDATAGSATKVAGVVVRAGTAGTTNYPGQVLVV